MFDYYYINNFNFPGEIAGDNPEFPMIIHDISHVLGNYHPTPEEEMEAAMEWISIAAVSSCRHVSEKGHIEIFLQIKSAGGSG